MIGEECRRTLPMSCANPKVVLLADPSRQFVARKFLSLLCHKCIAAVRLLGYAPKNDLIRHELLRDRWNCHSGDL